MKKLLALLERKVAQLRACAVESFIVETETDAKALLISIPLCKTLLVVKEKDDYKAYWLNDSDMDDYLFYDYVPAWVTSLTYPSLKDLLIEEVGFMVKLARLEFVKVPLTVR